MRTSRTLDCGVLSVLAVVLVAVLAGCPAEQAALSKYRIVDTGTLESVGAACGEVSVQALTARKTVNGIAEYIQVGTVTVSNDEDNLYVVYSLVDNWAMNKTYVHVGLSSADYPGYGVGVNLPAPLSFAYRFEPNAPAATDPNWVYVAVTDYALVIPFADLGLEPGACGDTFYLFINASVAMQGPDGHVVGDRLTAWGGDLLGDQSTRWYMMAQYELQCCEDENAGKFRTQTQGGWGTKCSGNNPGCYRNAWFDVAFPDGLTIGCIGGRTLTFTSSQAVQNFLPAGGKAGALKKSYTNPARTEAGVLGGQLTALALTLGFDAADPDFSASRALLSSRVLCNTGTACDGMTVQEVFDEASLILGGCGGSTGLTASQIADALALINENYVDGTTDLGFICAP